MAQNTRKSVLLVKTGKNLTSLILQALAKRGLSAYTASTNTAAIDHLDKNNVALAFIDLDTVHPQRTFDLLAKIRNSHPQLLTVMTCDIDSNPDNTDIISSAVRSIKSGCCDFITTADINHKLDTVLDTLVPDHNTKHCASEPDPERQGFDLYRIIGKSSKLANIINLAKRIAFTSAPVLISGESGTGKELIAQLIHYSSTRSTQPFVRVNCASLSESLLESELFGHEKGAFTGALTQRKGRFESAHGGTILLDEITETPLNFQAKLLRILEMQSFERVGGNESIHIDARVLSTSNRNLIDEVKKGNFRLDLYYRLSGLRLVVPPLRHRPDDLPELIWHFINMYAPQSQRIIKDLDPSMIKLFEKYSWPGNIRQLRNVVMTSLILGSGTTLALADVSWILDELEPLPQRQTAQPATLQMELNQDCLLPQGALAGRPLDEIEKITIIETLKHTDGNQLKAAKSLGISDRTLRVKIKKYRQQGDLIST